MISAKIKKYFSRGALGLLAFGIFFVGFVGYLHTPSGRQLPIARKLLTAFGSSCPADAMTSSDMDQVRKFAAENFASLPSAPEKKVLSFMINKSTKADVDQWLLRHHGKCTSGIRGYAFLKCQNTFSWAGVSEVDFSFSQNNVLVAVDVLRNRLTASEASSVVKEIFANLKQSLGPPSLQTGELTDHSFRKDFETLLVEYNYSDYTARVSVSVLPRSGVAIYEQYLSLIQM